MCAKAFMLNTVKKAGPIFPDGNVFNKTRQIQLKCPFEKDNIKS